MNVIQVAGIHDTHLMDIFTKSKVRVAVADDDHIDLMVGGEQLSIYLGKHCLTTETEICQPSVSQTKLEE